MKEYNDLSKNNTRGKFKTIVISTLTISAIVIIIIAYNFWSNVVSPISKTRKEVDSKAQDFNRVTDIARIEVSLKLFESKNGFYPTELSYLEIAGETPIDPTTGTLYKYGRSDLGDDFRIGTTLQDINNIALENDNDVSAYGVSCHKPGEYCAAP